MITKNQMKHLSGLSKIEMSDSELELYSSQMTEIIALMDTIKEIDTSSISINRFEALPPSVFRGDVVMDSLTLEEALSNAPEKSKGLFRVPKVME